MMTFESAYWNVEDAMESWKRHYGCYGSMDSTAEYGFKNAMDALDAADEGMTEDEASRV